ncbi:hypothetical protein BO71DRAFT_432907 [Aspergillus ellipticus CBS 707.79]|uniref:Uncharacterized protein n=1 Tax=Aspergillus ellipticus CBS 707.79 TaxID=1448320 RepID=A0A319D2P6_9EURO|nr:hypothetical protein BO71DRAFT_432907 [Aspergillus ellipticus CBS 707.79]
MKRAASSPASTFSAGPPSRGPPACAPSVPEAEAAARHLTAPDPPALGIRVCTNGGVFAASRSHPRGLDSSSPPFLGSLFGSLLGSPPPQSAGIMLLSRMQNPWLRAAYPYHGAQDS